MSKKYTVIVPGLLKANGEMALYGQEVTKEDIANLDTRVEEGYLKATSEFETEKKEEEKELQEKAAATKKLNDDYQKMFGADAPGGVTDDQMKLALKDKKAIGA